MEKRGKEPRWPSKPAVLKEDQFTAAPGFLDGHDSEHLPLWSPLATSWYGLAPKRRVFLMTSVSYLADWGRTSAAFLRDDLFGRAPPAGLQSALGQDPRFGPITAGDDLALDGS